MDNMASIPIQDCNRRRRVLLLFVAAIGLICLIALLIRSIGAPRVAHLPDGSILMVAGVTVGTNHVLYSKPWHKIIRALPFLPKRIFEGAEPFGWVSTSPSLIVWCSWKGLTPESPPPEFVLVDKEGTELSTLEKGGALRSYADMFSIDNVRGIFGVCTSVPPTDVFRLRIYQSDRTLRRTQVADFEFMNPAHAR